MAATMKDIARRTGLGLATISSYFNGGNFQVVFISYAKPFKKRQQNFACYSCRIGKIGQEKHACFPRSDTQRVNASLAPAFAYGSNRHEVKAFFDFLDMLL